MPEVRRRLELDLSWRSLARIAVAAVLVWIWFRTWQLFLVLTVSVLLAVTLDPVVCRLERRLPRWAAAAVVIVGVLVALGGFLTFAATSLPSQGHLVATRMVEAEHDLAARVPEVLRDAVGASSPGELVQAYLAPLALSFTRGTAEALLVLALATILTFYLLIEGRTTWEWLVAFVPLSRRGRVMETAVEAQRVVFGYVAGNIATSVFATLFVVIALSLLHVPAALLLAVLAGLCDFVPVLGFIASAVPAIVLALAVSPATAITVLLLYIAYHTLENYVIAPWVYGDRLRLSNVAVVLSFAVGAALAGVVGALIALPLAAAYPAIERIWLREPLGARVVAEHAALDDPAS